MLKFSREAASGWFHSLLARQDIDVVLRDWVKRNWMSLLLGLGILLRLIHYLEGRFYWLDEASLAGNIQYKKIAELFGPLEACQLAPPGFLLIEWVFCRIFGAWTYSLRFYPLVGGIASLFLLREVAMRLVRPGAVGIAVGLACISDDLVYFSAELKQYSTDVTLGLVCYLIALDAQTKPLTRARAVAYALMGALIVWFSHPAVFVLAGLGSVLLCSALKSRDWSRAGLLLLIGLAWGINFGVVHRVAMEQLGHSRGMWAFWEFAFPRVPPTSIWDATWVLRRILYFFVNPLNFNSFLGPLPSLLPVFALFLIGGWSLAKRRFDAFGMLILPLVYTLLAAHLERYPFHSRLILFLVPAFFMLIAEGADYVREALPWRFARVALVVILFLPPVWASVESLSSSMSRGWHNYVGDRRPPPSELDPSRFPFQ